MERDKAVTDHEITATMEEAARLWPEARLNDAETKAWHTSLKPIRVSTQQAWAVLGAVRIERGRRKPPFNVINQRLRNIAESEARGRAANPSAPAEAMDYGRPQGMVIELVRLWGEDPNHERWARMRASAVAGGTIGVMRRGWRNWIGNEGPYAKDLYEQDAKP